MACIFYDMPCVFSKTRQFSKNNLFRDVFQRQKRCYELFAHSLDKDVVH